MGRVATMVGINYFGTKHELHGCINDVNSMSDFLVDRFGFDADDIEVITDAPDSDLLPTGANIRRALRRMVDRARSGDVLLFHYSGHGTLINPNHCRGQQGYQAIVPSDHNLITNVDFRHLVNRLPPNVSFTIISDSCHSGGLIDKETEQIGPHVTRDAAYGYQYSRHGHRSKAIPYQDILDHVASLSGIESDEIGDHMLELFGEDRSIMFSEDGEKQLSIDEDDGILLSGCQTNETSCDKNPRDGEAYGAFTHSLQMVMERHEGSLSNRQLVMRARIFLSKQGFKQHPCLYCSDDNADTPFLLQPDYDDDNDDPDDDDDDDDLDDDDDNDADDPDPDDDDDDDDLDDDDDDDDDDPDDDIDDPDPYDDTDDPEVDDPDPDNDADDPDDDADDPDPDDDDDDDNEDDADGGDDDDEDGADGDDYDDDEDDADDDDYDDDD